VNEFALSAALSAALAFASMPVNPQATAACVRDPGCRPTWVVAHRTECGGAPENSRAGVLCAAELGIPMVETDVRLSADGVPVILHDATLDRTTDLRGRASDKTAEELAKARLSNGEPLPTFEELYAKSRTRVVLVLDFKDDAVMAVADFLARQGSFDDAVFFVSDETAAASARAAKMLHPGMMVMVSDARWARDAGAQLVQENLPGFEKVESLRRQGLKVIASVEGADYVPGFRRMVAEILIKRKVAGLLTNEPKWLKGYLSAADAAARR